MAAKIKDGLFIGDEDTSKDPEFLDLNKISNLVNLAGKEVNNTWSSHGLVYLTYNWEDRPDFNLFDKKDDSLVDMIEFIDTSLRHGVSVLLFSKRGVGRCAVAVSAYLMCKYHWGFEKTFTYISSKKLDVNINDGFVLQLCYLEKKIKQLRYQILQNLFIALDLNHAQKDTLTAIENMRFKDWDPCYIDLEQKIGIRSGSSKIENSNRTKLSGRLINSLNSTPSDELVVINSYNNSRQTIVELPGPFVSALNIPKAFKLKFNLDTKPPSSPGSKSQNFLQTTTKPIRGAMKGSRQGSRQQQAVLTRTIDKQKRDLNMLLQQQPTPAINISVNKNNGALNASSQNVVTNGSAEVSSKSLSRGSSSSSPTDSSNSNSNINNDLLRSESKDSNNNESSRKIVSKDTLRYPSSTQQQKSLPYNSIAQPTEPANNTVARINNSSRTQPEKDPSSTRASLPSEERLHRIVSNMEHSRKELWLPINQQQSQTLQRTDDFNKILITDLSTNASAERAKKLDSSMPPIPQPLDASGSTTHLSTSSTSDPSSASSKWPPSSGTNLSTQMTKLPPANYSATATAMKSFEAMQLEGIVRASHNIDSTEFKSQSPNIRISEITSPIVSPKSLQYVTTKQFPRSETVYNSSRLNENNCTKGSRDLTDVSWFNQSDIKRLANTNGRRTDSQKSLQNSVPKVYRHGSPVVMRSAKQMPTASSSSGRGTSSNGSRPPARSAWSNTETLGMDRDRGDSTNRASDIENGPQNSISGKHNTITDPSVQPRYSSPITVTRASPRPASPMAPLRAQSNGFTPCAARPASPSARNIGQHQSTASLWNTSSQHNSNQFHGGTRKAISGNGREEAFHMGSSLKDYSFLNEDSTRPNTNAFSRGQSPSTRIRSSADTQTQGVRHVTSPPDDQLTNPPRGGSYSARPCTPTRAWRF